MNFNVENMYYLTYLKFLHQREYGYNIVYDC